MPLTFIIPLGLIMVVAGIILHISTKYKLFARLVIGLALAFMILTIGVILLAVRSM